MTCWREVFEYAVNHCTVCIATPALAEALLGGHESLFGLPRVEFVDFDIRGARTMHALLGDRAANNPSGSSRKIAKFDAMIVATYLVRGRVGAFISADKRQSARQRSLALLLISASEQGSRLGAETSCARASPFSIWHSHGSMIQLMR
ncbi:hypothetical protein ACNOYE_01360 [Nannocystaceae bacterium ST9]